MGGRVKSGTARVDGWFPDLVGLQVGPMSGQISTSFFPMGHVYCRGYYRWIYLQQCIYLYARGKRFKIDVICQCHMSRLFSTRSRSNAAVQFWISLGMWASWSSFRSIPWTTMGMTVVCYPNVRINEQLSETSWPWLTDPNDGWCISIYRHTFK